MSLQLVLERERLQPGDWIAGTVFVHAYVPARSLAVHVTLFESTRSYTEEVLSGWTGFLWQGPIPERSSHPFRLQLPPGVDEDALVHPGSIERLAPGTIAAVGAAVTGSLPEQTPNASSAPGSFAAGWHPDPWLEKRLRYWDGNAWTAHTAD